MEKEEAVSLFTVGKNRAGNKVIVKLEFGADFFSRLEGGISEIKIVHDFVFRGVGEGKLYSYQRLKKEGEISYTNGYYDGYYDAEKAKVIDQKILEKMYSEELDKAYREGYEEARKEFEKIEVKKVPKPIGKGGRKSALTDGEKAEVKALHELGESLRKIAERYGVSHQTIKHIVVGRNLER